MTRIAETWNAIGFTGDWSFIYELQGLVPRLVLFTEAFKGVADRAGFVYEWLSPNDYARSHLCIGFREGSINEDDLDAVKIRPEEFRSLEKAMELLTSEAKVVAQQIAVLDGLPTSELKARGTASPEEDKFQDVGQDVSNSENNWIPATKAQDLAERMGLNRSLSYYSKKANEGKFRTKPGPGGIGAKVYYHEETFEVFVDQVIRADRKKSRADRRG